MKKALLALPFLIGCLVSTSNAQSENALGKVFWKGTVDNKVHLVIKGGSLEHKTIEGQEKPDGVFAFTAPLPDESVTVEVLRRSGRSKKVKVIQQPAANNDFTAIIEIHDDGGGAKEYQLEIFWR